MSFGSNFDILPGRGYLSEYDIGYYSGSTAKVGYLFSRVRKVVLIYSVTKQGQKTILESPFPEFLKNNLNLLCYRCVNLLKDVKNDRAHRAYPSPKKGPPNPGKIEALRQFLVEKGKIRGNEIVQIGSLQKTPRSKDAGRAEEILGDDFTDSSSEDLLDVIGQSLTAFADGREPTSELIQPRQNFRQTRIVSKTAGRATGSIASPTQRYQPSTTSGFAQVVQPPVLQGKKAAVQTSNIQELEFGRQDLRPKSFRPLRVAGTSSDDSGSDSDSNFGTPRPDVPLDMGFDFEDSPRSSRSTKPSDALQRDVEDFDDQMLDDQMLDELSSVTGSRASSKRTKSKVPKANTLSPQSKEESGKVKGHLVFEKHVGSVKVQPLEVKVEFVAKKFGRIVTLPKKCSDFIYNSYFADSRSPKTEEDTIAFNVDNKKISHGKEFVGLFRNVVYEKVSEDTKEYVRVFEKVVGDTSYPDTILCQDEEVLLQTPPLSPQLSELDDVPPFTLFPQDNRNHPRFHPLSGKVKGSFEFDANGKKVRVEFLSKIEKEAITLLYQCSEKITSKYFAPFFDEDRANLVKVDLPTEMIFVNGKEVHEVENLQFSDAEKGEQLYSRVFENGSEKDLCVYERKSLETVSVLSDKKKEIVREDFDKSGQQAESGSFTVATNKGNIQIYYNLVSGDNETITFPVQCSQKIYNAFFGKSSDNSFRFILEKSFQRLRFGDQTYPIMNFIQKASSVSHYYVHVKENGETQGLMCEESPASKTLASKTLASKTLASKTSATKTSNVQNINYASGKFNFYSRETKVISVDFNLVVTDGRVRFPGKCSEELYPYIQVSKPDQSFDKEVRFSIDLESGGLYLGDELIATSDESGVGFFRLMDFTYLQYSESPAARTKLYVKITDEDGIEKTLCPPIN
jgi:hypothetical protein